MTVFDTTTMRDDIVASLLEGEQDLETSRYLDRLVELASLEEAEHQFLIEPFDRSVALVFQLFRSKDLDPWDVNLTSFLEMFDERIKTAENIDLPTCGRLIRMAWQILRGQASTLIERQDRAWDDLEDDFLDFDDAATPPALVAEAVERAFAAGFGVGYRARTGRFVAVAFDR